MIYLIIYFNDGQKIIHKHFFYSQEEAMKYAVRNCLLSWHLLQLFEHLT